MSKHTPGPWEIAKPAFGEQHIYVSSGNSVRGKLPAHSGRQHICVVPYEGKRGAIAYHEMFNANARLIAAAPELLEALKLIASAENSALDLAYCKGIARAAIAKTEQA
jgi:hypothetical protein